MAPDFACFQCRKPIAADDAGRVERQGPYGYADNLGLPIAIHFHRECAETFGETLFIEAQQGHPTRVPPRYTQAQIDEAHALAEEGQRRVAEVVEALPYMRLAVPRFAYGQRAQFGPTGETVTVMTPPDVQQYRSDEAYPDLVYGVKRPGATVSATFDARESELQPLAD